MAVQLQTQLTTSTKTKGCISTGNAIAEVDAARDPTRAVTNSAACGSIPQLCGVACSVTPDRLWQPLAQVGPHASRASAGGADSKGELGTAESPGEVGHALNTSAAYGPA